LYCDNVHKKTQARGGGAGGAGGTPVRRGQPRGARVHPSFFFLSLYPPTPNAKPTRRYEESEGASEDEDGILDEDDEGDEGDEDDEGDADAAEASNPKRRKVDKYDGDDDDDDHVEAKEAEEEEEEGAEGGNDSGTIDVPSSCFFYSPAFR
jgi:hypothetical protein